VTTFVLVPSPLLGPESWRPAAHALREAGEQAEVVPVEDVIGGADVVVVPHSNAGYYAASISARATVYVDAALPLDGGPDVSLAPPDFYDFLTGLADGDGLLPPWTQWWDEDLADLFPDDATRARIEAGQPRLPLSYFERRIPVTPGWASRPSGYLAFGTTYAEELAFARAANWPVAEIDGAHLHQLVDPDGVAAAIIALADRAGR
jgi:hypothetical protein